MMKRVLLAILFLSFGSAVCADEPVFECWEIFCVVDFAHGGTEVVSLYNLPDGSGSAFNQAQLSDGTIVDATLRMQLLDCNEVIVASFPAEDMWLESVDGELTPCVGGTTADSNTDADGWATWASPLRAGGYSTSGCQVVVMGMVPTGGDDLLLHFNSSDLNGDGTVNLMDLTIFTSRYFGPYDYSVDFHFDGQLNLLDVARLAPSMGRSCP
jgi:hypothetical protein